MSARSLTLTVPDKSARYLQWLCDDSALSSADIVRGLLNVAMRLDVEAVGVENQAEFERRVWAAMGRNWQAQTWQEDNIQRRACHEAS